MTIMTPITPESAEATARCYVCHGIGYLPNFMDAPGHPRCGCGRMSTHESGWCGVIHDPVPCPRCRGAVEDPLARVLAAFKARCDLLMAVVDQVRRHLLDLEVRGSLAREVLHASMLAQIDAAFAVQIPPPAAVAQPPTWSAERQAYRDLLRFYRDIPSIPLGPGGSTVPVMRAIAEFEQRADALLAQRVIPAVGPEDDRDERVRVAEEAAAKASALVAQLQEQVGVLQADRAATQGVVVQTRESLGLMLSRQENMRNDYEESITLSRRLAEQLAVVQAGHEAVWFWQAQAGKLDDGNEAQSLSCPVVMAADTARAFIQAETDAKRLGAAANDVWEFLKGHGIERELFVNLGDAVETLFGQVARKERDVSPVDITSRGVAEVANADVATFDAALELATEEVRLWRDRFDKLTAVLGLPGGSFDTAIAHAAGLVEAVRVARDEVSSLQARLLAATGAVGRASSPPQ